MMFESTETWIAPPPTEDDQEESMGRYVDDSVELDRKTEDLLRRCEALVGKKEDQIVAPSKEREIPVSPNGIKTPPRRNETKAIKTPPRAKTPENFYFVSPGNSVEEAEEEEEPFCLPTAEATAPVVQPSRISHLVPKIIPEKENDDDDLLLRAEAYTDDELVATLLTRIRRLESDLLKVRLYSSEQKNLLTSSQQSQVNMLRSTTPLPSAISLQTALHQQQQQNILT